MNPELKVTVNKPPEGGSILVSPLQGEALNTTFHLSTDKTTWADPHTPLQFTWAYQVVGSAEVVLVNDFRTLQVSSGFRVLFRVLNPKP